MGSLFKIKILFPLLLIIVVILAWIAYSMYHKPHADFSNIKPAHTITAQQLYQDYDENEEVANEKYLGKVIQVNGKVKSIKRSEDNANVYLDTGSGLGDINCAFMEASEVEDLEEGDPVSIRGLCSGKLMDISLERCIVLNK